jgi:hypothetical protein
VERAAKELGLFLNVNETKVMVQFRCNTHIGKEMKLDGGTLEVVDEFVCLGICITKHRDELKDIKRRIGLAKQCTPLTPLSNEVKRGT